MSFARIGRPLLQALSAVGRAPAGWGRVPVVSQPLGASPATGPGADLNKAGWGASFAAQPITTAGPRGAEASEPTPAASASTSGPVRPSPLGFAALSADPKLYKEYLDDARHRIFGTHIGNGQRSGRKVLRKKLVGDRIVNWYITNPTKRDAIFKDPRDDQKKRKLATLKRRGKGPPPKGQGKRSKKK